jgi:cytochrome c-type biogenesis protein CcmE
MDLTPREPPATPGRTRSKRRIVPMLVLVLVIVAGGVVVTQFLGSAIDYYCNVDEIGVRDGCDGDRRLRVQGTVDEGSLDQDAGRTTFSISFNGVSMPVSYQGAPGGIFQECIPVVVHGRLTGDVFEGDRIEVRHSNEYAEDHGDRIDQAGSAACLRQG